jgi:RimJ/RimL family protein N-acetyltransferase
VDEISFKPMDQASAEVVVAWRYPGEYARYDHAPEHAPQAIAEMLRPELRFFACDRGGALVGFCSFGLDGQVPGGAYDDTAIDVGAGLRPDLTGKGWGCGFLRVVVGFGRSELGLVDLRATIASWNERAMRVATRVGFRPAESFVSPHGSEFVILLNRGAPEDGSR